MYVHWSLTHNIANWSDCARACAALYIDLDTLEIDLQLHTDHTFATLSIPYCICNLILGWYMVEWYGLRSTVSTRVKLKAIRCIDICLCDCVIL
jgi:hypothetical protein